MEEAAALLGFGGQAFWTGAFVFIRVGAAMALLPAFGEQAIPQRLRLGLALGFTLIVAPAVAPLIGPLVDGTATPVRLLPGEVLAGLALGLVLRLFILALQIAGTIAAQATSLSQILGVGGVDPMPAVGHLLVVAGLALAVMAGLHVRVAEALILSYEIVPPGFVLTPGLFAEWGVGHVAHAFALAFTLAAPFVIASLLYNVALGVINRAMPQLMVAFVGAPAITAGALGLLFLSAPILMGVWLEAFGRVLDAPFEAMP